MNDGQAAAKATVFHDARRSRHGEREGERSGRRAHVVAGQNICSAAAREWGRGLTSRRTSLCVYLGNNYVNGFSSLPARPSSVAACLPACSAHPPSGQSCSLSLFLFYHSFVAQFAGKHDVLLEFVSVGNVEKKRSTDRPTSAVRRGMDVFGGRRMRELPTAAANM